MRLGSVDEALSRVGAMDNTRNRERLNRMLTSATMLLESYLKTSFERGERSDVFLLPSRSYKFQESPVVFRLSGMFIDMANPATISAYGSIPEWNNGAGGTPIDGAKVGFSPEAGYAHLFSYNPKGRTLVVTYTSGFATEESQEFPGTFVPVAAADVPEGLTEAVMYMVESAYRSCGDDDCEDGVSTSHSGLTLISIWDRRDQRAFLPVDYV